MLIFNNKYNKKNDRRTNKNIKMKTIFTPQKYNIEDIPNKPFIDADEIREILSNSKQPSKEQIDSIIEKSLSKKRLSLQETAILLDRKSVV